MFWYGFLNRVFLLSGSWVYWVQSKCIMCSPCLKWQQWYILTMMMTFMMLSTKTILNITLRHSISLTRLVWIDTWYSRRCRKSYKKNLLKTFICIYIVWTWIYCCWSCNLWTTSHSSYIPDFSLGRLQKQNKWSFNIHL